MAKAQRQNVFTRVRQSIGNLITGKQTMSLPQQFMKYGNRGNMYPNWENVVMSDEDHYKGLGYAIIQNRAAATARVAKEFIQSKIGDKVEDVASHPYLPLIKESPYFSETQFWDWISRYLDLEGVYYLYCLRNPDGSKNPDGSNDLGAPMYFKLLNPYSIQRVINQETMEVGAYIETRGGFQRKLPVEQIIEIRELNPFDWNQPYAMTDAARDDSYTLNTSGDYTRQSLRNNINAPGAITTDVMMEPQIFENFVARVTDHTKGEPLFGNGSGAINWTDMAVDLSKASLEAIDKASERRLLAVGGESKTTIGIEESGTTRETARVQTDIKTENHTVPRIQLILDALNMDYRKRYKAQYTAKAVHLAIKNPVDSDQDVEEKKVDIKQKEFDLFDSLVEAGYDEDLAARYSRGEIGLKDLGTPTNDRRLPDNRPVVVAPTAPTPKKKAQSFQLNDLASDQESMLQNALANIEMDLAAAAIDKLPKLVTENAIKKADDLISKEVQKDAITQLKVVLQGFYSVISTLQGKQRLKDLLEEHGLSAAFILDKITKQGIKKTANLVAESHVATVTDDLYVTARNAAAKGKGQAAIISELTKKYSHDVSETRAKAVARTETNRAFTTAQYEADRQFIKQNDLEKRAYKQYETRSENPCAFCEKIVSEGLIPFDQPFRKVGDKVVATIDGKEKTFNVNFVDVEAGNLHTNCNCIYRLVIKDE